MPLSFPIKKRKKEKRKMMHDKFYKLTTMGVSPRPKCTVCVLVQGAYPALGKCTINCAFFKIIFGLLDLFFIFYFYKRMLLYTSCVLWCSLFGSFNAFLVYLSKNKSTQSHLCLPFTSPSHQNESVFLA